MNGKKNRLKQCNPRKGALLMMLLVLIIIGGIIALRMLPQEDTIARRDREVNLHNNLSEIRQAFDLRLQTDPDWNPDLSDRTKIKAALQALVASNALRTDEIKDPTVPDYLWDTSDEYFWRVSQNYVENSSCEKDDSSDPTKLASWTISPSTIVASDPQYISDPGLDDYPYQNLLGNIMGKGGTSVKITK
jgi:type II secretory pathway pseudopilin PulG